MFDVYSNKNPRTKFINRIFKYECMKNGFMDFHLLLVDYKLSNQDLDQLDV